MSLKQKQLENLTSGLLEIDDLEAGKLLWDLSTYPEQDRVSFVKELSDEYDNRSIPESLQVAALLKITEQKDLKSANLYAHYVENIEGGNWGPEVRWEGCVG